MIAYLLWVFAPGLLFLAIGFIQLEPKKAKVFLTIGTICILAPVILYLALVLLLRNSGIGTLM